MRFHGVIPFAVAVIFAGSAAAQTVGIGTTKGGATAQLAAAIAKVVSSSSDLEMRTQPMGGTQQYIPVVNAGELEFGLSNLPQYWMAKTGTGLSKRKHENLELVANMMVFQIGVLVANNSDIRSTKDLKGKRVPWGLRAAPLFDFVIRGYLANGGVSEDEITKVPAVALRQKWDPLIQGKIDVAVGALGTGAIKEMNAKIDGGIRFATLDPSEEAVAALLKIYPKSYLSKVEPHPSLDGVREPIYTLDYDYMLWTHKGVSDEVVYKVAKAMYENEKDLKESSPLWRSHSSKTMAKDQGTPYHAGAVKFYKEVGLIQ